MLHRSTTPLRLVATGPGTVPPASNLADVPGGEPAPALAVVSPVQPAGHVLVVSGVSARASTADEMRAMAQAFAQRVPTCGLLVNEDGRVHGNNPILIGLGQSLQGGEEPALVVLRAPMVLRNGTCLLKLDAGRVVKARTVFEGLATLRSAPVQLVFTSRHGAALLQDATLLPPGSMVVVLTSHQRQVTKDEVLALAVHTSRLGCVDACSLLLMYCACLYSGRDRAVHQSAPEVFMPNGSTFNLDTKLQSLQGQPVSPQDRDLLDQQLGCLVNRDRVKAVIENIESGGWIADEDHGLALAMAAVLNGVVSPSLGVPAPEPDGIPCVHNALRNTNDYACPPLLNEDCVALQAAWASPGSIQCMQREGVLIFRARGSDRVRLTTVSGEHELVLDIVDDGGRLRLVHLSGSAQAVSFFWRSGLLTPGRPPSPDEEDAFARDFFA